MIGIHVAFAIAAQSPTAPGASTDAPSGGDIMYVSHPFAMNITIVPQTFRSTPSPRCANFATPSFHASHP